MEKNFYCDIENEIKSRDLISPSPYTRAHEIWSLLQRSEPKPTLWDLICFSVETLGVATAEYPILLATVKLVTKLVYSIHYNTTEHFPSAYGSSTGQISRSNMLSSSGARSETSPKQGRESRVSEDDSHNNV